MFDNLEKNGVESQKVLYAPPGDQVIDVYSGVKSIQKFARETMFVDVPDSNI